MTGGGGVTGGHPGPVGPLSGRLSSTLVLGPGERLLATLAVVGGIGPIHLERHVARLEASAAAFGIAADAAAWRCAVHAAAGRLGSCATRRLRLLVDTDGAVHLEEHPWERWAAPPVRLAVDDDPVDERDDRWHHKTSDRRRYAERAGRHPEADDVVLVNRQGMVTEATRANLLVRYGGRWWTPPVDSGCLPGVGRQVLLERRVVGERAIGVDELGRAEALAVVSSVRGWRPAVLSRGRPPV